MNRHKNRLQYQRKSYNKAYFEGWYYKQVTADGKHTISFIPGVNFEKTGANSFIQIIHLNEQDDLNAFMIDYPIEAFSSCDVPFSATVGKSVFSLDGISLDVESEEIVVKGNVQLLNLTRIKTSTLNPNIMGWFSYIPFMECNHDIVSMHHELNGSLIVNGQVIDFTGGIGYIEKDWGRSFPSSYVWIESNHFDDSKTGLFCSVATIPFLAFSFEGFICNLIHKGVEYRFATYNGSKLLVNERSDNKVRLKFMHKEYSLEIQGEVADTQNLIAPKMGSMNKTIKEGLSGKVEIHLKDKYNQTILEAVSHKCGMELVETLLPK